MTQKEFDKRRHKKREENGLCHRCGKKRDREGFYCKSCLEKTNRIQRENRIFYRKYGLCTTCGREKVFGDERQCISCRQKAYEKRKVLSEERREEINSYSRRYQKRQYQEGKEQGICTRCGKLKAVPGKVKCGVCQEKENEIRRRKRAEKENITEYRRRNGLCRWCGEQIDREQGEFCTKCYTKCCENLKKAREKSYWKKNGINIRKHEYNVSEAIL